MLELFDVVRSGITVDIIFNL